jgi:3-methyl-2-oxobutanoate hydroxymethyltransferase
MSDGRVPRFVKRYAGLHDTLLDAACRYADDVPGGRCPDPAHSYQ